MKIMGQFIPNIKSEVMTMKYTKILSLVAAAAMAVPNASMYTYAEGDNITEQSSKSEQIIPSKIDDIAILTTIPATTEQTVITTTVTTAQESDYTVTTTEITTETTSETYTTTTTAETTTVPVTTTAAETTVNAVKVEPVCEHIIKSDINGRVFLNIPDGASADVSIEYQSPEYDAHQYYNTTLLGGNNYYFDIEGRDISVSDYRVYKINVILKGGMYNMTADVYTDTFNIPDGNDNPDSFRTLSYTFSIDDAESDKSWNVISDDGTDKKIAVHLNSLMLGDVNQDSSVDSSDASLVLSEYAALSTGGQSSLSDKQKKAADVNKDGFINSSDSSKILSYYAEISTGGKPSWD